MSGNEGKQNSQMSMRDIEEEEMAQELMNMQMYEVGMNFEEMKEILRFVNESKDMAGIKTENQSSQEATEYEEEIRGGIILSQKNSLHELSVEENSLPKPSYSYRQQQSERKSPTISGHKSTLGVLPVEESVSAGSQDMFDNEEEEENEGGKKIPKRSNTDGESKLDKLMKANEEGKKENDKDDVNENRSQTRSRTPWKMLSDNSQNSQNSLSGETSNQNYNKSKKNQRIERWKLDPTDSVVEENDLPLKDRNRATLRERIPYCFCHNKRILDKNIGDKVLAVLNHTLEEVADIWRSKHRPDASEFQWGSPIKVGANIRSLDKKRVIEDADSPERCEFIQRNNLQDSVQRRNTDRNCKRKAVENVRDMIDDIGSSEDGDNIFERVKKAKKTDELWQPPVKFNSNNSERGGLTRRDKILNNIKNSNDKLGVSSVIDDWDSDEFDNDDLSNLRQRNKKKDQEIAAAEPATFPRRIIPPNPSKPKAVRRVRKNEGNNKRKSPVRKSTQAVLERDKNPGVSKGRGRGRGQIGNKKRNNNNIISDEEISNELENDVPEEIDLDEETVIKPMPVKGLANKLNQGTSLLLEKRKAEEKSRLAKIQAEQEAEMEERTKREEREVMRYLKEKEEEKAREKKERDNKAKEETWRKNAAARDRERRRTQAEKKARSAEAEEGVLLMDEDDDDVDTLINNINARQKDAEKRIQCPICLLEFSQEEIHNHAADCNQFDNIDQPGTSRSPADNDDVTITNDNAIYDCNICSNFTTTDGIVYEDHIHNCVKNRKDRTDRQNQLDSRTVEIVEVPSSPVRSYIPISKMTGSSINYAEQFPQEKVKPNTARTKRRQ